MMTSIGWRFSSCLAGRSQLIYWCFRFIFTLVDMLIASPIASYQFWTQTNDKTWINAHSSLDTVLNIHIASTAVLAILGFLPTASRSWPRCLTGIAVVQRLWQIIMLICLMATKRCTNLDGILMGTAVVYGICFMTFVAKSPSSCTQISSMPSHLTKVLLTSAIITGGYVFLAFHMWPAIADEPITLHISYLAGFTILLSWTNFAQLNTMAMKKTAEEPTNMEKDCEVERQLQQV